MAEASVFDVARCAQALKGQLAPEDHIEAVGRDDVTHHYWVATQQELIVLDGSTISARLPLDASRISVGSAAGGVDVRVRKGDGETPTLIGTFRRHNKLTRLLADLTPEAPTQ